MKEGSLVQMQSCHAASNLEALLFVANELCSLDGGRFLATDGCAQGFIKKSAVSSVTRERTEEEVRLGQVDPFVQALTMASVASACTWDRVFVGKDGFVYIKSLWYEVTVSKVGGLGGGRLHKPVIKTSPDYPPGGF
jgi:hypothetical protein